jgi:hypothetical protein
MTATLENRAHQTDTLASETRTMPADPRGPARTPFTLKASLREVPPGQYLLHLEATSDADKDLAASRAIPIEVRDPGASRVVN